MRLSLFTKILLWFFLNLLALTVAVILLLTFNQQLPAMSRAFNESSNAVRAVAQLISIEVREKTPAEREQILQRYSSAYQVDFLLYTNLGQKVAGRDLSLPAEILTHITAPPPPPPFAPPPEGGEITRPLPPPPNGGGGNRPPFPLRKFQTDNPRLYWAVVRIPLFEKGTGEATPACLIARSDLRSGHGLFFDPLPWILVGLALLGLSILLWVPFVRSLTKAIRQMTNATQQIAEENFAVRVEENRNDELGRLGGAINHLTERLSGFVTGQKRFLGDISHELNSPLARMQFALSILEERLAPNQLGYVADVQEEVELMAKLVSELLSYSKAGMNQSEATLSSVELSPLLQQVILREAAGFESIYNKIDEQVIVQAHPELLMRALANIIRNAIRYAGGRLTISAQRKGELWQITCADGGNGVPEKDLNKLFDPFFRIESDRARSSGGTGLGLAIVKSCIDGCGGTVSAKNHLPHGLEIIINLKSA